MKYIDLYAGIGGFRLALDKQKHKCVFSAEIDPRAIQTYEHNFKDNAGFDLDSLNEMTNEQIDLEIPDHDLLTGGFPCQPFSNAGNKLGFNTKDTKGTQFNNILKILEVKKPNYILLENVSHLAKHDSGKTWKLIKESLIGMGYSLTEKLIELSPENFGIPQSRKRVFIVGFKNKKPPEFHYEKVLRSKNILEKNIVDNKYVINKELEEVLIGWQDFLNNVKFPIDKTMPVIWADALISSCKIDSSWPDWKQKYIKDMNQFYKRNKKFIDSWYLKYNVKNWSIRNKKLEWQAGKSERDLKKTIITLRQSGIRCKAKPIFPTLVAMVQIPIIFDDKIDNFRYLTPREVARLQSFPDTFKLNPIDNSAYKQFGNAVNVKVVEELVKYYFNK